MGLHWELSETNTVVSDLETQIEAAKPLLNQLNTAIENFQSEVAGGTTLSGQAYTKLAASMNEVVAPVIEAFDNMLTTVDSKKQTLSSRQQTLASEGAILDEDEIKQIIHRLENMKKLLMLAKNTAQGLIDMLDQEIKRQQKKITKLHDFQSSTSNLFAEEISIFSTITEALDAIRTAHLSNDGSLSVSEKAAWLAKINKYNDGAMNEIAKEIDYPKGLSKAEKKEYKAAVMKQLTELKNEGWANSSLQAYVAYLNSHKQSDSLHQVDQKKLNSVYQQSQLAGSKLFISMWDKWETKKDKAASRSKLEVLLKIVHVSEDLSSDPKNTAELLSHFSKDLAPHDKFWDSIAETVQWAFPQPEKLNGDLGKKVNNLRYVISAEQAQYVRDNYQGKTDEDKLANYFKKENVKYTFDSDRLHQKISDPGTGDYPEGYGTGNFKILVNFHNEFIINSEGRFQNEIDPEGASQNGVVNGASFNYANVNDYSSKHPNDPKSVHGRIDIHISKVDPLWRKQETENNAFEYPGVDDYQRTDNGNYVLDGKSVKERSDKLKNEFKRKF